MPQDCHAERYLAYPVADVYALVADVESYPAYMPGWRAARILHRTAAVAQVEQIVSLAGLRKQFHSVAHFDPPHGLVIQADGDPFRHFRLAWRFTEATDGTTLVQADLTMIFRSGTMERLATHLMPDMLGPVINALEHRAATLLKPALPAKLSSHSSGTI
jgi:coenzyme Q-binding protein COQ10